jgi:glyoxylase I family protein
MLRPMAMAIEGCAPMFEVFDMPTSIRFYRDVLGFRITRQSQPGASFDWALLEYGPIQLMLNTAYEADQRPPRPDPARIAAHADTSLFFGCQDLEAAYAYLRDSGVAVEKPQIADYGMKQLWLKDPDGYVICFQWRVN